jgi:hypothetical protein
VPEMWSRPFRAAGRHVGAVITITIIIIIITTTTTTATTTATATGAGLVLLVPSLSSTRHPVIAASWAGIPA